MRTLLWDAINPLTGTPYTWGDPNLRWGDPSYALEPGDPGFVPYANTISSTPPPKKGNKMKRQNYYPTRQADQTVWLENFRLKLPGYAAVLNLLPATVTDAVADARWMVYLLLSWLEAVRTHGKASTTALELAQSGTGAALVLPVFTPPPLPAGVVARPEGALRRIFDLVAEIKVNNACTDALLQDLGILGSAEATPDFSVVRPDITAIVSAVGVELGWGWQGLGKFLDQCEIQVDRSDGKGWVVLTFDTTPGYQDSTPFPAVLTKWKYRAIYRVNDAPIGLWSAEVSVSVGG